MAGTDRKRAPSKAAQSLISRDYTDKVGTLGEDIYMNRHMLLEAIGHFDPEHISFARMYQMKRDPILKMGMQYIKAPLIRAKWHIECEDPRVAAAIDEIIRNVYGPYMRTMLNMLDFGFQAAIKRFKLGKLSGTYEDPETGKVKPIWENGSVAPMVLDVPIPMPPEYTTVKLEKGEFKGFNSTLSKSTSVENNNGKEPDVPAEWALWLTNEFEDNFRNWYGYTRYGYAYRYWWSSWFRHHMEDRHFEMDADPPMVVWYPPGSHTDPVTGETISNKTTALQIGQEARQGATIAVPSDVYVDENGKASPSPLWKLEFLTGGENLTAFRESSTYLNIMKLRAMLVPEQALMEGEKGHNSRASSGNYQEVFKESLADLASDIADHWTEAIIPQLVEANFGADSPKATMVPVGFEEEDLTLATELIKAAFTADPNALPVDFEKLLEQTHIPLLTKEEQEEKEKKVEEAKEEAERVALQKQAQEGAAGAGEEGGGTKKEERSELQMSQLLLHQGSKTVHAKPPKWAIEEFQRRKANQHAIAERIESVAKDRYETLFGALVEYVEDQQGALELSVKDTAHDLADRAMHFAQARVAGLRERIVGELASMYHAAGAAELSRLGLDLSAWDVGREEVQEWAEEHAGELIKTMDTTVVDQHLRPLLASALEEDNIGYEGQDPSPVDAVALAQKITDKFQDYPDWMARRVARTESRTGYNQSAADTWERVGVGEVQVYDGQGGVSGKTDEKCLDRNGEIVDLETFRQLDADEHPNGTYGGIPHVPDPSVLKDLEPGVLNASIAQSASIYAVTSEGNILSEREIGDLLAV